MEKPLAAAGQKTQLAGKIRLMALLFKPILLVQDQVIGQDADRFDPGLVKGFILLVGQTEQFGQLGSVSNRNIALLGEQAIPFGSKNG